MIPEVVVTNCVTKTTPAPDVGQEVYLPNTPTQPLSGTHDSVS
jgi:hypothetical protein